jgi:hypothetical protein
VRGDFGSGGVIYQPVKPAPLCHCFRRHPATVAVIGYISPAEQGFSPQPLTLFCCRLGLNFTSGVVYDHPGLFGCQPLRHRSTQAGSGTRHNNNCALNIHSSFLTVRYALIYLILYHNWHQIQNPCQSQRHSEWSESLSFNLRPFVPLKMTGRLIRRCLDETTR